jgi:hypothetical protein
MRCNFLVKFFIILAIFSIFGECCVGDVFKRQL